MLIFLDISFKSLLKYADFLLKCSLFTFWIIKETNNLLSWNLIFISSLRFHTLLWSFLLCHLIYHLIQQE